MSQLCQVLPEAPASPLQPCPAEETQNACSFQKVKPWFFKPRKSKYGLEDDSKRVKKYNSLHWSQEENKKYVFFLRGFLELINGDIIRKRKYHLNRMLSRHIGSRSPVQCRSHHQKMIKAYGTPEAIISHFLCPSASNELNSSQLTESLTPLALESCSSQHLQSLGTHAESKIDEEGEKLKNFQECGRFGQDEAMLWDVLTYPLVEDSFNDL